MKQPNTTIIKFSYVVLAAIVGAAGVITTNLNLQADSWFEWETCLGTSSQDADTDFAPNSFDVWIQDTGTGRYFSNVAVPQVLYAAAARFNPLQKRNTFLAPQTSLQLTFTDLSGQSTNNVKLVLQGYKHFTADPNYQGF